MATNARDELPENLRDSWQAKVIEATRGRQSRLGTILIAALGYNKVNRFPRFHSRATITSDGNIMCDFWTKNGQLHMGAFVGSVNDLTSNARGLADHCLLTDNERVAMFEVLRQWIATDYRARIIGKVPGRFDL